MVAWESIILRIFELSWDIFLSQFAKCWRTFHLDHDCSLSQSKTSTQPRLLSVIEPDERASSVTLTSKRTCVDMITCEDKNPQTSQSILSASLAAFIPKHVDYPLRVTGNWLPFYIVLINFWEFSFSALRQFTNTVNSLIV